MQAVQGCGCAASVLCSKIMDDFQNGLVQNILFMATGALMESDIKRTGGKYPVNCTFGESEN